MLRTAFSPDIREALDASDVIEVLVNPDGRLWLERAGQGLIATDTILSAADRERVIRIVASSVGDASQSVYSIISA